MIARDLISDTVPSLKTSDTAARVLDWMSEFKVEQLPVVNNAELLGLVTEEDLLDVENPDEPIGNIRLSLPEKTHENEEAHMLEVVRVADMLKKDVLPVLKSRDHHILGIISKTDIIEALNEMLNYQEPGGIMI